MAATVLISGANRGIGRGLVQKYLTRPNTTVLAAVRSPSSEDSQSLQSIAAATGSRVVILKVDSTSDEDALEAIEFAKSQGITAIDTVIANAGTFTPAAYQPVADVDVAHVKDHLDINTVGPVRLFQAVFPLLQKSENAKFIVISSLVGTIGGLKDIPYPNAAYGASKAAVNFFTRKIHFENEDIVTLAVHPGAVKTVSGNEACQAVGFPEAFVEIQDSVNALVAKFDAISKEDGSGEFWGYDGSTIPW